jgi:hypothetical protein
VNIKQFLKHLFSMAILLCALTNTPAQNTGAFSPPQNMGGRINSTFTELLMYPAPNGLSFYFTSVKLTGSPMLTDIYVSKRSSLSSPWGEAQILPAPITTTSQEGITGMSPDGLEMFIQSNRPGGTGTTGNDIYVSTRTDPNDDSNWSTPVNLGAVINTTADDSLATYFVDPVTGAGTLFFSSDRNNTAGNRDVYQSTRNANGTFNTPTAVTELNSPGDDSRLAIRRDGLELFFASTRPGPPTGFAIYTSTRTSLASPWSTPVAVTSLNTAGANSQPALSPDGSILYYVSSRPGGFGGGDLYAANRCSLYATSPCSNRSVGADFDGDGRSDISVFRPSEGTWYVLQSGTNTFRATPFGVNGDKLVPGDYDGDGRTDMGVYRAGTWYLLRSSDGGTLTATNWGVATDKAVPADYDGDGKTDVAVFRDGVWYIVKSSNGAIDYQYFGLAGDVPIAGVQ